MDLYLGIGDLPIYNFDKMLQTNNLSYMVLDWNERKDIEPPEQAQERWDDIYNEYCKRTANNDALSFYSLSCEIGYLETRYYIVANLIYSLNETNKKEIGRELNAWKIPFNINGKVEPQIKQLQSNLKFAAHILERKKTKLENLKGDEEENKSTSFIKQAIIIQEQLSVKIEMKKDSVEYFLTCIERIKEKLEQQKKVSNG